MGFNTPWGILLRPSYSVFLFYTDEFVDPDAADELEALSQKLHDSVFKNTRGIVESMTSFQDRKIANSDKLYSGLIVNVRDSVPVWLGSR